ncbi:MAG: hypothetical protein AMXMBFR23_09300 [Chloroflexota bacterium]
MQRIGFVYNLQTPTWRDEFRAGLRPRSYLLAPNNATPANRRLAAAARADRRLLLADNGNFVLISALAAEFRAEAEERRQEVVALERRLKRSARPRDISTALRDRYRDLATRVQARAEAVVPSGADMRERQRPLDPTHLIGVESLVQATWMALDIEPEFLGWPRSRYRTLNARVAREARAVDLPDDAYTVASAVSYNTAYDAGRVFADAGIQRVAMGFGAYMVDQQYTDFVELGRRTVPLDARVPRRNVRTAAVARGFAEGYASVAGGPPRAFHCLGLGTPKMMAAAALALWGVRELTFDATSPMRDAAEGTLYVTKPTHQKVRTRKVALRLATDPSARWGCPCAFCTAFEAAHPFDYDAAHRWAASQDGKPEVEADDLRPGSTLYEALPLMGEPKGGAIRGEVTFARMGHNHWAIERLIASLRRSLGTRERLRGAVDRIVTDYAAQSVPTYADAARVMYLIAAGEGRFATPGT